MHKQLLGLAAVSLLTPAALANNDNSWLELDNEISALTSMVADNHGTAVSGYISSFYSSNSDANEAGWGFKAIRINFKSQVEDFKVKVSTDLKGGTAVIKDAYVSWAATDSVHITLGEFKTPFLWSFTRSGANQLFHDNSANAKNEDRDLGLMVAGPLGDVADWMVALTNGDDGATDEHRITARVEADVAGEGAFFKREGGVDAPDEGTHASVALSYVSEGSMASEHTKLGIEAALATAGFMLHIDAVDWDVDGGAGIVTHGVFGTDVHDSMPIGITASYMLQEDVEVAIRMEDIDDTANTERLIFGANYYQVLPHTVKWMLNYEDTSSDNPALETETIRLGLVVSF